MSISDIIDKIKRIPIQLIEITGGEPLLQTYTLTLIDNLIQEDRTVVIETNGSISIKDVNKNAHLILDIKTPSSRMSDKMDFSNLRYLDKKDEVKFVLSNRYDYDWSIDIINRYDLYRTVKNVLLSAVYEMLDLKELAMWMVQDALKARLNTQIHKYIFGEDKRGV
ncbi:organic radical activating enzyme [Candidatus Magnetoovum chiemensis]|nr:organic radical activating enzyme [Candidatus Magnetoovum chiemensis]